MANKTLLVGLLVIAIIIAITLVALMEIHPPWLAVTPAAAARFFW